MITQLIYYLFVKLPIKTEIVDHYNNGAGKYYASAPEAPVSGYKTVSYSPPTTALLEADQSPLMQTSTIASFT